MTSGFVVGMLVVSLHSLVPVNHSDTMNVTVDSRVQKRQQLPGRYLSVVKKKTDRMVRLVNRRTNKVLDRLLKQERRMKARLHKMDSVAADNIFTGAMGELGRLQTGEMQKASNASCEMDIYLDSLQSTLQFLREETALQGFDRKQLPAVSASVASLAAQLQHAGQVRGYIRMHKQVLQQQLAKYAGFSKDLQQVSKTAYYYTHQLNEYKTLLKDKKKAEIKALAVLRTIPAFSDFLQKHTEIATFFNQVAAHANLDGLQTRSQVAQFIQQRLGNDPAGRQAAAQQLEEAGGRLNQLKDKFPVLDNTADIPDFRPDPMKTKSLLQRLEPGGNIQFQRSGNYYPATSDIAGQIGYRFHRNGTIGIGVTYKLGLGVRWNDITISHQGVGVRAYVDWMLKGIFFVNGGFEENHVSVDRHTDRFADWSGWQGSALLGMSMKYKVNAKLKGNIALLYDVLAVRNVPPGSSLKLRFGYHFR